MDKLTRRGYLIGGLQINVTAPEYEDSPNLAVFRHEAEACDLSFEFCLEENISEPKLPLVFSDTCERRYGDGILSARTLAESSGDILLKVTGDGKSFSAELDAEHPEYFGSHVVIKAMELPKLLLNRGMVFLHASLIKYRNRAILFTADKQVGKSTQAAMWEKYMGAEVINGDRALIRVLDGVWTAFGSPYSGTSKLCRNDFAPIAAIVILGQAEKTVIRRADGAEALAALLSGVSFDTANRTETEKCLEICGDIIGAVPFYRLDCTPEYSAVAALNEVLREKRNAEA